MAFLSHEQLSVTTIQTFANLTMPTNTHGVRLQATANNIVYTMDGSSVPTATIGMVLVVGNTPEDFNVDDIKKIKFISASGTAKLEVHYYAGRDI